MLLTLLRFSLIDALITLKVRICNKALEILGTHVFAVYIFQRIPMTVLNHFSFAAFTGETFAARILLAVVFNRLNITMDKTLVKA